MIYHPQDAEDVTQEILIKLITKLSTFDGRSSVRRGSIASPSINHVLNMKRARLEELDWTFERYADGLNRAPDADLPDPRAVPADVSCSSRRPLQFSLVVREARTKP